ncbi:MAG: methionine--tRNA ligase, partial [Pelagibacteraceae bacterium]|nr:methionine--tRNA ligase [Pelagibacteraceae bacterium]
MTTPIYYPSAKPHMGHAYSSISADVIARFKRLQDYKVFFLTGTDEHGQKIQKAAEKEKKTPLEFCDQISKIFLDLCSILNLSNTDFIRTTEKRHYDTVQHLWNLLQKNDEIYLSKYSGWYSVSDEAFYSQDEIEEVDGIKRNIASGSPVEWVEEESYFFRLSKWTEPLIKFYKENPDFIQPESRRNEVVKFVESGLKDLSISRTSFNWGIPVPNDDKHIMYVWMDALTNYISATNYFSKENNNNFWPADIHIIGKDILRFHAVYWPAFLMAAKINLPKKVFGHGWILSGEEKMSKSKGNILDPIEIINEFGLDELRYYLMKEVIYGQDGKINLENLKNCINSDLANNIGNLSQRIITILLKKFDGRLPAIKNLTQSDKNILETNDSKFVNAMNSLELHNYVRQIVNFASDVNKYVNDEEPWNIKRNSNERIANILY